MQLNVEKWQNKQTSKNKQEVMSVYRMYEIYLFSTFS